MLRATRDNRKSKSFKRSVNNKQIKSSPSNESAEIFSRNQDTNSNHVIEIDEG